MSLSLNKRNTSRFGSTSKETLKAMATVTLPKTSARSSKWATKTLRDWLEDYNYWNPENECPEDLLLPFCSKEILNKCLCIYVIETQTRIFDRFAKSLKLKKPAGKDDKRRRLSEGAGRKNHEEAG